MPPRRPNQLADGAMLPAASSAPEVLGVLNGQFVRIPYQPSGPTGGGIAKRKFKELRKELTRLIEVESRVSILVDRCFLQDVTLANVNTLDLVVGERVLLFGQVGGGDFENGLFIVVDDGAGGVTLQTDTSVDLEVGMLFFCLDMHVQFTLLDLEPFEVCDSGGLASIVVAGSTLIHVDLASGTLQADLEAALGITLTGGELVFLGNQNNPTETGLYLWDGASLQPVTAFCLNAGTQIFALGGFLRFVILEVVQVDVPTGSVEVVPNGQMAQLANLGLDITTGAAALVALIAHGVITTELNVLTGVAPNIITAGPGVLLKLALRNHAATPLTLGDAGAPGVGVGIRITIVDDLGFSVDIDLDAGDGQLNGGTIVAGDEIVVDLLTVGLDAGSAARTNLIFEPGYSIAVGLRVTAAIDVAVTASLEASLVIPPIGGFGP